MPKHEIFHKPGDPVSDQIKWIIDKYFDPKEVEKLERLGGRILISIAAPYKRKMKKEIAIDEEFITNLRSHRRDTATLKTLLDELSIKQLRTVCQTMEHPLKSNAKSEEIKRELIRSMQAEDFWSSISQSKK